MPIGHSTIAYSASNRVVFPVEVSSTARSDFFNSTGKFFNSTRNELSCFRLLLCGEMQSTQSINPSVDAPPYFWSGSGRTKRAFWQSLIFGVAPCESSLRM